MKNLYYELPLQFALIKKKNAEHPLVNYEKSIAQNIYMLITSRYGEHRYDPSFGCEIWETDFELVGNVNIWKERVRKSAENLIHKYETRLKNLSVDTELSEEEIRSPITERLSIKKRLKIKVKAISVLTGEDFIFETKLFISPLSID
jgi:phage baseplate assembly protein W